MGFRGTDYVGISDRCLAFAPGYVFLFFSFMMVLQLIWVRLMVPETKGRQLEDIEHDITVAAAGVGA